MMSHHLNAGGRKTLEVKYSHLSRTDPLLSMWLADSPRLMLDLFNQVSLGHVPITLKQD
jgi:hypothetical protein